MATIAVRVGPVAVKHRTGSTFAAGKSSKTCAGL